MPSRVAPCAEPPAPPSLTRCSPADSRRLAHNRSPIGSASPVQRTTATRVRHDRSGTVWWHPCETGGCLLVDRFSLQGHCGRERVLSRTGCGLTSAGAGGPCSASPCSWRCWAAASSPPRPGPGAPRPPTTASLDLANPPELLVSPPGGPGSDPTPFYDACGTLAGRRRDRADRRRTACARSGNAVGAVGRRASEGSAWLPRSTAAGAPSIARPRLVAGRMPDATRARRDPGERTAGDASRSLHVGDHIDGVLLTSGVQDVGGRRDKRIRVTPFVSR